MKRQVKRKFPLSIPASNFKMENKKEAKRKWNLKNRKKKKLYWQKFKITHKDYIKEKRRKDRQSGWYKKYHKKYMKNYSKKENVKIKSRVRLQTQRVYGKVPKGYERHHINYDGPHNFILIPIQKHKKLHLDLKIFKGGK